MKRDQYDHTDGETRPGVGPDGKDFFELGMMYTLGSSVPVDYVSAHKWFNLAAMAGNQDAFRFQQAHRSRRSRAGSGSFDRRGAVS